MKLDVYAFRRMPEQDIGCMVDELRAGLHDAQTVKRFLHNISHLENNEDKIDFRSRGGIEVVIASMNAHANDCQVQYEACAALHSLAFNTENQVAIGEHGGVEAVVRGLNMHRNDCLVQSRACGALWNLAHNSQNKAFIRNMGGIEAIVCGMNAHPDHLEVQHEGCAATHVLIHATHNSLYASLLTN